MKILFCTVPFRPSTGGIETVSALLAERFQALGHEVVLATQSKSSLIDTDAFRVVRQPTARQLVELVRRADVVFHNNISLRLAWPLLFVRRPWVIAHHTWLPQFGLAALVKRSVLRVARHIAVSRAVAASLPVPSTVVPNPYADDVFVSRPDVARRCDLLFVGRLVSDKGVSLLLEALGLLRQRGRMVGLTVIGDGPEAPALRRQATVLGIDEQVTFTGRRAGSELAASLNAHRVLVVPSVWEEPFGVVALEAMACGCVPLVARSGGLPDAVGGCGVVVTRGNVAALADGIELLMSDDGLRERLRDGMALHLARHTRDQVARDYLGVIDDACRSHATQSTARAV